MSAYSVQAFRRSIVRYTSGRVLNALTAFVIFVWVARYITEVEYAKYVAAFAILELGLVAFGFGMEWVTAVYIPQVRLKASGRDLGRFVWECAGIQIAALVAGALLMILFAPALAGWLQMKDATNALRIYGMVMLVEGCSRVFRDQLLSCLLLQGAAQTSQMLRNFAMLGFAYLLATEVEWRSASTLALAELCASGLSLAFAVGCLYRYLHRVRDGAAEDVLWRPPGWGSLLRSGWNAWLSNLANLCWGGQIVILIATRFMGPEATAALGFTRNLAEQIRRYMPMEFMFGVVRTILVARFVEDGDARQLAVRVNLMYRANLLFLLPILVLAVCLGAEINGLFSNGQYASARWYLVGWLVVLLVWAHHRGTDLLAHALGRSDLCRKSSLRLLVTPLLILAAAFHQVWWLLFLIQVVAEMVYTLMVVVPLKIYRPNWTAIGKLIGVALSAWLLLSLPIWGGIKVSLVLQTTVAFFVVLGLAVLVRVWSPEEVALAFRGAVISDSK
ncbi:Membrane protein involved in the export of O-antigen and teichoic acid [Aromatoleum tolulyticum]|uniref:Membrane protein involved in the export of O-antigen and teichoic acid n=1 Tax=Aromatoleum tolulyticum TaxID=34027 RepID=A0A1N6PEU0_9RHOO|nr:oligosaccharide flippase family protein [Aromatoleum tolulyticum]SIQ02881.1 Membrane protein involved in the export of O-antigen and teichoic acid [Aromatoleum tolulyticum]